MFRLFKDPMPTFDDVASDEAKRVRAEIRDAAKKALMAAAQHAADGHIVGAQEAHRIYGDLWGLSISIPLDMIRAGL